MRQEVEVQAKIKNPLERIIEVIRKI